MSIILKGSTAEVRFRGESFVIDKSIMDTMIMMRLRRISGGYNDQFKDANGVCDHFASRGIHLKNGGEVCPTEMAIHFGPSSSGAQMIETQFGRLWFNTTDWKPDA